MNTALNEHQGLALKLMRREYNDCIGGLENTLMDYSPDEEEYIKAYKDLHNQEYLLNTIYKWTVQEADYRGYAKHIRFAGTDWLKDQIKARLIKDRYYKES